MILLRLRASLLPCTLAAVQVLSLSTGSARAQLQFGPATQVDLPISIGADPSLSSDGLTLYFASLSAPGGQGETDIWTATRSTRFGLWGAAVNLGLNVNSSSRDAGPSTPLDGLSLYFHSTRPGGLGDRDIYVATRATTNDSFASPVSLGHGVNSQFNDGTAAISADGLTLVFASDRPGGFSDQDLYIATRPNVSAPFGAAANLGSTINRFVGHGSPSFSADSLSLFFAAYDGVNTDLYASTRGSLNDPWGAPVNLGPNVNSPFSEDFGEFARDGKSIVFISDRSGIDRLYEAAVVPEPSALALAACCLVFVGLAACRRRRIA
jgi:Tol biopolymer transport system component